MPLPEHLGPQTYWEKRAELMEDSVERIVQILVATAVPSHTARALDEHMREWARLIGTLASEYPAPTPKELTP